jgi:hypothetical protein
MYKLMTLATVLVALALAPVLSGMGRDDRPREPSGAGDMDQASGRTNESPTIGQNMNAAEQAQTCEWACQACDPDQGCRQLCTEIGDCGNTCGVTARCDAQHTWNDEACACVLR